MSRSSEERPEKVGDTTYQVIYNYLDGLRESGVVNMLGAGPYVERTFDLSKSDARKVHVAWIEDFSKED